MTEERDLRIPFNEVNKISIECGKCGAELIVNYSNRKLTDWGEVDWRCVVCNGDFDSQLKNAFIHLSQVRKAIEESKAKVFFRIGMSRVT